MPYYRTSTRADAPLAPYDKKAALLFSEAEKKYQAALLDAFSADNQQDFGALTARIAEQCKTEAATVETRYKPLKILPALLMQYLEQELYK